MAIQQLIQATTRNVLLPDLPDSVIAGPSTTLPGNKDNKPTGDLNPPDPDDVVPTSKILDFTLEYQPTNQINWCWAAITVSIANYHDPERRLTQNWIVNSILQRGDCSPDNDDCDKPWCLQNALHHTGNLVCFSRPLEVEEIWNEIVAERPVACRITYNGTDGHFLVIAGVYTKDTEPWLEIYDPKHGKSFYSYAKFVAGYRNMAYWTDCYRTKKEN